jgi:hypothetical protein
MRKPEVSPLVSIRDGIQVVAILPRHEKARLEWEILQDDDVYRRQMVALRTWLSGLSAGADIRAGGDAGWSVLSCLGISAGCCPGLQRSAEMPATELVHQTGFVLRYVLLISVMSALIADVLAGRGLPNAFRRALLDRLPAEQRNKQHGENTNDGGQYRCCAESAGVSGLLLKGRAVAKTSVLMSLKARVFAPQRLNSDCVASGLGGK